MAFLELQSVSKGYGSGSSYTSVLKDIDLSVDEGEFLAIVGFTGSGKTTLINLIAGLLIPDQGAILLHGKPVTGPGPDRGIVFQNYSLLPWLTVYDNVFLAVKEVFPKLKKVELKAVVQKYITMVGLWPARNKRPAELSGGMKQRVSVARALAMRPEILLLDEPLSALDALTRGTLQDELAKISAEEKKTIVLITNDVDEGIILADRIIPLTPGPKATLGPEFRVNLPRPRDKKALNRNPDFISLRNKITRYLMDVGIRRKQNDEHTDKYILPDLRPRKFVSQIYHR